MTGLPLSPAMLAAPHAPLQPQRSDRLLLIDDAQVHIQRAATLEEKLRWAARLAKLKKEAP